MNKDGSGLTQLTTTSPNNFPPDWQQVALVNVSNLEELYSAVNNSQNAGSQIVISPGVYMLSAVDPTGTARPNSGRLELQQNMSLQGVFGDRSAVVIDAANLPASSFNNAAPMPLTGAIRTGRGANAIEWLTVRNTVAGSANIETDLVLAGPVSVRVAHIASTGSQRGIDVRNFGAAGAGRVLTTEVIDSDFNHNRAGGNPEGLRFGHNQGANGGTVIAYLSGN